MPENTPQSTAEQKAQVQAYFSRTAENYVASTSHRTGADLQRLLDLGEWDSRQHTLDIATGGGHTARTIAPFVALITVSDLTPTMLESARKYLLAQGISNAQFQVADAEALPFADASFDRVTCRIAPHHFPSIGKAVQEVVRVLIPGGLFLLIDNIAPSDPELDQFDNTIEKWRDASHGRSCTREEWRTFFSQAGLSVEHEEFFRRTLQYDDWTLRSQLPVEEKARLESYMLGATEHIQRYFDVDVRPDGHLQSFATDFILLKGRKPSSSI